MKTIRALEVYCPLFELTEAVDPLFSRSSQN